MKVSCNYLSTNYFQKETAWVVYSWSINSESTDCIEVHTTHDIQRTVLKTSLYSSVSSKRWRALHGVAMHMYLCVAVPSLNQVSPGTEQVLSVTYTACTSHERHRKHLYLDGSGLFDQSVCSWWYDSIVFSPFKVYVITQTLLDRSLLNPNISNIQFSHAESVIMTLPLNQPHCVVRLVEPIACVWLADCALHVQASCVAIWR